ncbi:EF-hand domain-containing protein [Streptomyces coeruleoprunus]|uniref:EF-hand domain-containing protein n=1 Tax=Streptomyces coeruleoprunus TaxID=285563 RepID=A0ABV9XJY6_9ACTN
MTVSAQHRMQFEEIDTDGDGYITADELKESLQGDGKVSPENLAVIVRMADEDGDRRIDLDEYAKFVR